MKKMEDFLKKGSLKEYTSGKKGIIDFLMPKQIVKNLDGKALYEGRGSFKKVLEQAVKDGVVLENADLRNKDLRGVNLESGKLKGASFDNSDLSPMFYVGVYKLESRVSKLKNADLTDASFKKAFIVSMNIEGAETKGADFDNRKMLLSALNQDEFDVASIKNLDKAKNVRKEDLEVWKVEKQKQDFKAKSSKFRFSKGMDR